MRLLTHIKIVFFPFALLILAGCSGGSLGICKYEQLFGVAKIDTIKNKVAFVSFTPQGESGKATTPPRQVSLPAPWGVKVGKEYPALLQLGTSDSIFCEKEKLVIIQEIGSSCKVK